MRYFFCILWLLSNGLSLCFGQKPFKLAFDPAINDKISAELIPIQCTDSTDLILQTNQLVNHLQGAGFLSAFAESYHVQDSVYTVKLNLGPLFTWLSIDKGNVPEQILAESGQNLFLKQKKPVRAKEVATMMEQILDTYADKGYPFAQIRMDSVQIIDGGISARLELTPNKKMVFDSIEIISQTNLSVSYLEKLLGIKTGDIFSASRVKSVPQKINQLVFLSLKAQPEVIFMGSKARLKLNLAEKKSNRFDVLIGIQQDELKPLGVRIAGEVTAGLHNRFGQGEFFGFQYKNRASNVQELQLSVQYPFLLNLPFGVNTGFRLFQNGDQFRNLEFNFGVTYPFGEHSNLGFYWQSSGSRLIAIDTLSLLNLGRLPDQLDVGVNGLGISFLNEKLDYRFNPRKGWKIALESLAGIKTIIPNIQIQSLKNDKVDFSESYDSVRGGTQLQIIGQLEYFLPLGKVMTLKMSNTTGWKYAQNGLFRNEAFRIGGNRILRGFDEESIYARTYSVISIEPRLIIGRNSWIFVFGESAFLDLMAGENSGIDYPFSFGAGLSFDTNAGILLISAAIGDLGGSGLDFNSTKVHFGYVSLF